MIVVVVDEDDEWKNNVNLLYQLSSIMSPST